MSGVARAYILLPTGEFVPDVPSGDLRPEQEGEWAVGGVDHHNQLTQTSVQMTTTQTSPDPRELGASRSRPG